MSPDDIHFWKHMFSTSVIGVAGVTYHLRHAEHLQALVRTGNARSLCGEMVKLALQIGSGVGLALSSAVVQAVDAKNGQGELNQNETGF